MKSQMHIHQTGRHELIRLDEWRQKGSKRMGGNEILGKTQQRVSSTGRQRDFFFSPFSFHRQDRSRRSCSLKHTHVLNLSST